MSARNRVRTAALILTCALGAAPAAAQRQPPHLPQASLQPHLPQASLPPHLPQASLPEHAPLNPLVASRSGLSTAPFRAPAQGWRLTLAMEYGSAVEVDAGPSGTYMLDAELFRLAVVARRDVSAASFVLVQGGLSGAHAGFGDGFFDGFHALIGHHHRARESRPRNRLAYTVDLASGARLDASGGMALSDLRVGAGRRHGPRLQSLAAITVPVSTAGSGHRRGVPALAMIHTARLRLGPRVAAESSLGAGYTPRHGPLAELQRPLVFSASSGLQLHATPRHALYGQLFYHSPVHRDLRLPELRGGELSVDFGAILVAPGGRVWHIGLVEDTRLTDGGIDLIVKLHTSW